MVRHSDRVRFLVSMLAPERLTRVVDVGANPINKNPYKRLVDCGGAEVWGFEPMPEAFAALEPMQTDTRHYLPDAVGDGAPGILKITKGGGFSSLLTPDATTLSFLGRWSALMQVVEEVPVETKRLDDIAALPGIDLLKIDVQGAELAVFKGARDKLSNALMVITEVAFVPLYEGQPLLDAQMRELQRQGFVMHKFLHQTARPLLGPRSNRLEPRLTRNQLIDGDAVFLRDLRRPEAMSDEQLKHMAILSDAVARSFDVALRCVDLLVEREAIVAAEADTYAAMLPGQKQPTLAEREGSQ